MPTTTKLLLSLGILRYKRQQPFEWALHKGRNHFVLSGHGWNRRGVKYQGSILMEHAFLKNSCQAGIQQASVFPWLVWLVRACGPHCQPLPYGRKVFQSCTIYARDEQVQRQLCGRGKHAQCSETGLWQMHDATTSSETALWQRLQAYAELHALSPLRGSISPCLNGKWAPSTVTALWQKATCGRESCVDALKQEWRLGRSCMPRPFQLA